MAISTKDVVATLAQGMGKTQADAPGEWLIAVATDLATVTAALDADGGVSGTSYADSLTVGS